MGVLRFVAYSRVGRAAVGLIVIAVVGATVVAPRLTQASPQAALRTATVARANVTQTVTASGSVNASAMVKAAFKPNGRLTEILVKVGDTVAVGQPLARLDTTDLQYDVRQAEANLISAQAKYDNAVAGATPEDVALARNALESARLSYEQAKRTTASDVASAERTLEQRTRDLEQAQKDAADSVASALLDLERAKTTFASAKTNFTARVTEVRSDLDDYESEIAPARELLTDLIERTREILPSDDTDNARESLNDADVALANVEQYVSGVLTPALSACESAVDALKAAIATFESALAGGADPTSAVSAYQSAEYAYQLAASRLSSAIDVPNGEVTDAAGDVAAAGGYLKTLDTQDRTVLADERADIARLQTDLTDLDELAAATKTKITQAGTSLASITSAVNGSYLTAKEAYDAAVTKASTSVQAARDATATASDSLATAQDKATSNVASSEISLSNAQVNYTKSTAGPKSTDVALALSSLQLAQLALEKAKTDLEAATLRAPVAGVIATLTNQVGEAPANPFAVIAVTSVLTLHGTIGESEVAKVRLGQVATLAIDAVGTGRRLSGKVTSVDPVATLQQGVPVYGIDVTIDRQDPAVRPGMTATATVIIESKQGVLTVPNSAIRTIGGRRTVQVLRDGEPVEVRDVVFGISNDTMTEVVSGLSEGDTVVLPALRTTTVTGQPGTQQFRGAPAGGQPVIVNR